MHAADLPAHARLLLAVRLEHGWSQAELADVLQVSKRSIVRWENDRSDPHPGRMAFIRQLLANVSESSGGG